MTPRISAPGLLVLWLVGCATSQTPPDEPDTSLSPAGQDRDGGDGTGKQPVPGMSSAPSQPPDEMPGQPVSDGDGDTSSETPSPLATFGEGCSRDTDCSPEYICDREKCIDYGRHGALGLHCSGDLWQQPCGEFLCKDGFCRSCVDDDECPGRYLCQEVEGYPGKGCFAP